MRQSFSFYVSRISPLIDVRGLHNGTRTSRHSETRHPVLLIGVPAVAFRGKQVRATLLAGAGIILHHLRRNTDGNSATKVSSAGPCKMQLKVAASRAVATKASKEQDARLSPLVPATTTSASIVSKWY